MCLEFSESGDAGRFPSSTNLLRRFIVVGINFVDKERSPESCKIKVCNHSLISPLFKLCCVYFFGGTHSAILEIACNV